MKQNMIYFKPYNKYGLDGYYVPVRNTFNNKIEREFIPKEARGLFEAKFGQNIISDQEFLDWYTANARNFQE
jgi:hypothetical protein